MQARAKIVERRVKGNIVQDIVTLHYNDFRRHE